MSTQTKIALVTGGSRGLGRDMALNLADRGIDVLLTYHSNQEQADEVVRLITDRGRKAFSCNWTRRRSTPSISSSKR